MSRDTELELFIWACLYSVANERAHIWRGLREEMDQLTRPFFAAHLPSAYTDSPGLVLNFISSKALTAASALVSAFTIMTSIDEHESPLSSSNSSSALDSTSFSHAGDLDDDAKLSVLYRRCVIISVDGALSLRRFNAPLLGQDHPVGHEYSPNSYASPTGKTITSFAEGTKKDAHVAVKAAKEAYKKPWGLRCPGTQRGRYLSKLPDLVEQNIVEMSVLELNVGKPFMAAKNNDPTSMIAVLRYYAGWADKIHGKNACKELDFEVDVLDVKKTFADANEIAHVAKHYVMVQVDLERKGRWDVYVSGCDTGIDIPPEAADTGASSHEGDAVSRWMFRIPKLGDDNLDKLEG
ncbi:hypothetical protein EDD85DRAFT_792228 [Armillaria nabsnona]|nr:hypothetical protein EDD85DRAFT_792228 [Armillaria nabsnona]